jgi:hypothetical protein
MRKTGRAGFGFRFYDMASDRNPREFAEYPKIRFLPQDPFSRSLQCEECLDIKFMAGTRRDLPQVDNKCQRVANLRLFGGPRLLQDELDSATLK